MMPKFGSRKWFWLWLANICFYLLIFAGLVAACYSLIDILRGGEGL